MSVAPPASSATTNSAAAPAGSAAAPAADDALLRELGYKPTLRRKVSGFTNFAVSFSVISILAGPLTSYYIGFANGGPIMMSWGWPLVSFFVIIVALAMAELASAMPTAGGLYYWASRIGSPAWGWFTGWLNLIGALVGVAAVGWGAAVFVTAVGNLMAPGVVPTTQHAIFVTFVVLLALGLAINWFGVRSLIVVNNVSAWWHVAGVVVLVGALIIIPDHHQSFGFVFTKTINASGLSPHLFWLVLGIGLLQAQYTIGGFDASAHLSEETVNASSQAAKGVYRSVVVSALAGWVLLLAVTFALPDVKGTLAAGSLDVQYVFQKAMGTNWALFLLGISAVAQVYCLAANMTSATRIMWALSRDRATPGHATLVRLNRFQVPAAAASATTVIAIVLMLPTFWNGTLGYAVTTSIAVIAGYTAYALPMILRLRAGDTFRLGAWHLRGHHKLITGIAVAWIAIIDVLFILPQSPAGVPFSSSFSWLSFNYTPLTIAVALIAIGGWWLVSARHWFRGPVRETDEVTPVLESDTAPSLGPVA
jgi:amino acid transporter